MNTTPTADEIQAALTALLYKADAAVRHLTPEQRSNRDYYFGFYSGVHGQFVSPGANATVQKGYQDGAAARNAPDATPR